MSHTRPLLDLAGPDGVICRESGSPAPSTSRSTLAEMITRLPARAWSAVAMVAAAVALVVSLVTAGGAPQVVQAGLPDPGLLTGWALPAMRLVFDLAAVATIGSLATVLLVPTDDALHACTTPALKVAQRTALAWAVAAALTAFFTVSDVLAVAPARLLTSRLFLDYVWVILPSRGLVLSAVGALTLAIYVGTVRRRRGAALMLALAIGALLPPLFSGHSAAAADHDLAISSLVVHVVAACLWIGGLLGMLWFLRSTPRLLAVTAPRYSALALTCFVLVAGSGVLNAWTRDLGDLQSWVASGYGALLLLKVLCLSVLGYMGLRHRNRTLPALSNGDQRAFVRLAITEVTLMATTVGVAVALSRTPPPADTSSAGHAHATQLVDVAPFTLSRLLTEWRIDAITLTLAALTLAWYLRSMWTLRRAGARWPVRRLLPAVSAIVVFTLATNAGLAAYSSAIFSAQAGQFLVLFLVVPVLVLLSAPDRLAMAVTALRSGTTGPPSTAAEQPRAQAVVPRLEPFNALVAATVLVLGLFTTPLLDLTVQSFSLHVILNLTTLVVGLLFWWSILNPDPSARMATRHRWAGFLGLVLMMGLVAARIYFSDVLLAGDWFGNLNLYWVDVVADQQRGALLIWASLAMSVPFVAILLARRSRPDGHGAP